MKVTQRQKTIELSGEELGKILGIEGCITSISFVSTQIGHKNDSDVFTSVITIVVKE